MNLPNVRFFVETNATASVHAGNGRAMGAPGQLIVPRMSPRQGLWVLAPTRLKEKRTNVRRKLVNCLAFQGRSGPFIPHVSDPSRPVVAFWPPKQLTEITGSNSGQPYSTVLKWIHVQVFNPKHHKPVHVSWFLRKPHVTQRCNLSIHLFLFAISESNHLFICVLLCCSFDLFCFPNIQKIFWNFNRVWSAEAPVQLPAS